MSLRAIDVIPTYRCHGAFRNADLLGSWRDRPISNENENEWRCACRRRLRRRVVDRRVDIAEGIWEVIARLHFYL